jgi:cell division protein FtsI/penicillin-binding protein 2
VRTPVPAPVSLTIAACLALAGCGLLGDDGPTAEDAADELASALSEGDLAAVSFSGPFSPSGTDDPQQWWEAATDGFSQTPPHVTADAVTERGDDGATARLHYRWSLEGGQVWEYDATAELTKADDTWRVSAEPSLLAPDLGAGERLSVTRVWAPRAQILGAGGQPIVTDRPVLRIGLDKTQVSGAQQQASSARRLAALVGVDAGAFAERVRAAGDKAFVEAIVLRLPDLTSAIGNGLQRIPGALGVDDTLPLAPTRDFARPILGTVGAVTAEIVADSDGVYQARYDERLRGTAGVTVSAVPRKGERRTLWEAAPTPGRPLHTTLDVPLQATAERLLAGVGPASALVALRPSTGEVLAAASGPGGGGLSTATVGQYAPGSTMKVVSSLALLRAGLSPGSAMTCPATTVVDGKTFKNYSDYPASQLGPIDLRRAVANSCNTAFIGQRGKVSQPELADAAASLGLGVDHDLGYPVFLGSVPSRASSETDHAASMIGQARVLASPVAMASVAASVAGGRIVVPVLVSDAPKVSADPRTPLTGAEAASLRGLMRGVVTSGSGASLADVPGAPVLAKTGTAEFGQQSPPQTHAWMIAAQGDLAVAVFVDVGESGSRTAGPILEAFLRAA